MALRADKKTLERAAAIAQALASSNRLHIIIALTRARRGLVASDIAALVGLTAPALSQQLRVLEQAGILEGEREGQHIRYRLARGAAARRAKRIVQLLCEARSPRPRG